MYKLFLILRYLRRKLAPMFAALAVTLCTAMVIIVISVMGGFLDLMRDAAQRLTGQIALVADITGMTHYDDLVDSLNQRPQIAGATPVIRTLGLIKVGQRVLTVEVFGIQPGSFDQVLSYGSTLHWSSDHLLEQLDQQAEGPFASPEYQQVLERYRQRYEQLDLLQAGRTLQTPAIWGEQAGMVAGIEVMPWSFRGPDGEYDIANSQLGETVTLTVVPLTQAGAFLEPALRPFTIVNEFKSGLYEIDANRVYVPFDALQDMLQMAAHEAWADFDPRTGAPLGEPTVSPGRASEVMIRGRDGVSLEELTRVVDEVRREVSARHPDMPPVFVVTWQQRHQTLLSAVEKEKGLLTILFAIISIVAIVMIGVIFYMIVLEKTRDIGTLRAIGAGWRGVASIFLGYGLAIGVVGALLGLGLAASIVWNLNEIQAFLHRWFGFQMWDPQVYYFERIPNRLDPAEVTVIVILAVISSIVGAIVPAWKAARLDPVEALRYE